MSETGAKRDRALAAADDQHVRLGLVAELLDLLVAQFLPGLGARIDTVPCAERPGEARFLFMTLEFGHRGQKRPDDAVLESDEAIASRDIGFERNPGFEHAIGLGRHLALCDAPVTGLHALQAIGQHVADLITPFHGFDVPGEGEEIPPIALGAEQRDGSVNIASRQCGVELAQKRGHPSVGRSVEHRLLPMVFVRRRPGRWDETCARFEGLASRSAASIGSSS